jgi:hypothetical protein
MLYICVFVRHNVFLLEIVYHVELKFLGYLYFLVFPYGLTFIAKYSIRLVVSMTCSIVFFSGQFGYIVVVGQSVLTGVSSSAIV